MEFFRDEAGEIWSYQAAGIARFRNLSGGRSVHPEEMDGPLTRVYPVWRETPPLKYRFGDRVIYDYEEAIVVGVDHGDSNFPYTIAPRSGDGVTILATSEELTDPEG